MGIKTPRDRGGTFDPQLVAKRQTRLAGLNDKILGLYAGGMTVRDIEEHLVELCGTTAIKRDTISRVTDAVLADVEAWRTRPLDRVYPIAYFDALMVKVQGLQLHRRRQRPQDPLRPTARLHTINQARPHTQKVGHPRPDRPNRTAIAEAEYPELTKLSDGLLKPC